MVKMYNWSSLLKEKDVTLAGMDKPLERRGFLNRFGHRIHDPVNRFGHVKVTDMPLRGYTGNYVGPRGKKTFEETSESGRQYGRERLAGLPGAGLGFGTGAALGSALGPLGTLAGGYAGAKIGANWRDFVGRGHDNTRMSRMWRAQQAALKRQQRRGNKFFPGKFAGKSAGQAEIADYIWKPGDPFKVYTDKGSHEIQRFMGTKGPVGGALVQFLNRLIGYIPGLRDPEGIAQHRARVERTRKGYKALEYYHKMKNGNPDWEMSDGDKRLVANMMHDFYSTENPDMDPKHVAMMANGATKWDAEQLRNIHGGLVHYLEQTARGSHMPPMREYDVRDAEAREASVGSELREEEMGPVSAAVRAHADRRKAAQREAETFEEGGPDDEYSDMQLLDEEHLSALLGDWKPLHQQLDDPNRYIPQWRADSDDMLRRALNEQKIFWHENHNKINLSNHEGLGATPEERLENFFLHENSMAMTQLLHVQESDSYNDRDKMSARYAQEALEQLVKGHFGTAWGEGHGPDIHEYSQRHGTASLNRIMSFMLYDSEGNDIGHAHSDETHGEYDPMNAISYFGVPQQPAQENAGGLDLDEGGGLGDVYAGHEG